MKRFADEVVMITGAASGIGAATARRFADEGAHLALCDLNGDGLDQLVGSLSHEGQQIEREALDVSESAQIEQFIATTVSRLGRLDVLVNNAGISQFGHVTELTNEQWRKVMAVDLDAIFYASRAALPHLISSKGSIVNTCSISGLFGDYGLAAYNTAKGAVANLTRNMAIDHAPDGVRVNAVNPGGVKTPLTRVLSEDAGFQEEYRKLIPMGRMAEPHEIAGAIAFLASEDASYITGINLVIDGGVTAATGQPNFNRRFREMQRERRSSGR